MTDINILPEGLAPEEEAQIDWIQAEDGTAIRVELGGVIATLKVPFGKEEISSWVVGALPAILNAAWDGIQAGDSTTIPEEGS